MNFIRKLRKLIVVVFVSLLAVLSLTIVASQIEQHVLRSRAESLLLAIQSLELRKTPWSEAQIKLERWKKYQKLGPSCDARACSMEVTLNEFVFGLVTQSDLSLRLDDYLRWRLKLHYDVGPFVHLEEHLLHLYMRMGGRPATVVVSIGMRDGIVWSKGINVTIETYSSDFPGLISGGPTEFALVAAAHSVPRFDYYGSNGPNSQLTLHPDYLIGRPDGCEICVASWAEFTPYAGPADVHRLMQFDLSCLTRWHPCVTQSDIMPAAWAQYLSDAARLDEEWPNLACSPVMLGLVGRDSTNIVTGKILAYQLVDVSEGYYQGLAKVRILSKLKGTADFKVGETLDVHLPSGTDPRSQTGSQFVFFGGEGHFEEMRIDTGKSCPAISANNANLTLIRRGIEQDYRAMAKLE
ncbi:MAG: hypothetical protein WB543_13470 [Candidatus Acidiferrum sp.]